MRGTTKNGVKSPFSIFQTYWLARVYLDPAAVVEDDVAEGDEHREQPVENMAGRGAPDGSSCADLVQTYPCREQQIRTLATLLDPAAAPCGNIVVHGTEATGKSVVTAAVLRQLAAAGRRGEGASDDGDDGDEVRHRRIGYAVVHATECVTSRHLFERTVARTAEALRWQAPVARRCETLAQLAVELSKMLRYADYPAGWRFVLVLDAIDRQREAPATLLAGLARLSEMIPRLTTVFIVTFPAPSLLRASFVPHVHFHNYTKPEFVELLGRTPPPPLANASPQDTADLWLRFCGAVHDALTRTAGRTLPAFSEACAALWPRFSAPVAAGTHGAREFSKLLIAARIHFQDESIVDPGLVPSTRDLSSLLPTTAKLFLLCAYLASHNSAKHDLTLFSTFNHGRKRRRGGGFAGSRQGPRTKHRKIARKLLGAHAFGLERMLAIFAAVRSEWTRAPPLAAAGRNSAAAIVDGDVGMAIATLASLRLLLRVGGAGNDPMDRAGKWRVNVGWEVVRSLGRSMGIEMEDWLVD
ncbi:origin recognition complex subunit [Grosmannia clavigera kw1407]|uniref:Origin recognition complex subunit n=1 Tax=Grosmannia clavigera (strain kw1407 / UAMH 11150) TaxID=655863 RepID=F0XTF1_GROCL|nr:origin recognition complex subunit [Grosmannia clavigera kw1407]EFW98837.1 origin recognition complex subunit [Grosmannia clavigera kw1407]